MTVQTFDVSGRKARLVEGTILGQRQGSISTYGKTLVMVDIAPADGSPHMTAYIEA